MRCAQKSKTFLLQPVERSKLYKRRTLSGDRLLKSDVLSVGETEPVQSELCVKTLVCHRNPQGIELNPKNLPLNTMESSHRESKGHGVMTITRSVYLICLISSIKRESKLNVRHQQIMLSNSWGIKRNSQFYMVTKSREEISKVIVSGSVFL